MKVEQRKQISYAVVKENEVKQNKNASIGATRKRLQISKAYHC